MAKKTAGKSTKQQQRQLYWARGETDVCNPIGPFATVEEVVKSALDSDLYGATTVLIGEVEHASPPTEGEPWEDMLYEAILAVKEQLSISVSNDEDPSLFEITSPHHEARIALGKILAPWVKKYVVSERPVLVRYKEHQLPVPEISKSVVTLREMLEQYTEDDALPKRSRDLLRELRRELKP